jgi:hypothetical protein
MQLFQKNSNKEAAKNFVPAVLTIYNRNREGFWDIALSQFLSDQFSVKNTFQKVKLGVELYQAFSGLTQYRKQVLQEFSQCRAIDINNWKSNRKSYFTDAYPIFAFLVIWMEENGLHELLERYDEVLKAAVFAVAGYGILDENVDGATSVPTEILTAHALIAEYEFQALNVLGATPANISIIHKMRSVYLDAEIREKACRHKCSPYKKNEPEQLGAKGANAVSPFMLCLEQLGKASLIDRYWEVFLQFGAVIQLIDDWQDLEADLKVGHYSYITIGYESRIKSAPANLVARQLRANKQLIAESYQTGKKLIEQSRNLLDELNDHVLERLVDITELRLEKYFAKELKMN